MTSLSLFLYILVIFAEMRCFWFKKKTIQIKFCTGVIRTEVQTFPFTNRF